MKICFATVFATLLVLLHLHVSERMQGRKCKGGSKLRAVCVNTITLLGLENCLEIEGGNESRGHSLLLRKRMKPVGMKYGVGFSTG